MSAKESTSTYRMQDKGLWPKAWLIAAGISLFGLVLFGAGFAMDADRAGYSFLFGFITTLTVLFGAMFLVIALHVTQGHWGITTRRIAELLTSGWPVIAVFGLVLIGGSVAGTFHMYDDWMHPDHGAGHGEQHGDASLLGDGTAHAQEHDGHTQEHGASAAEHEQGATHTPYEARAHHHLMAKKASYLNATRWGVFGVLYILVWAAIAFFYFRTSLRQDETKDKSLTMKMKSWAPISAFAFGLSLTFAAFDWVMALEPTWYSTIFGVVIFGGSAMTIFALLTLIGLSLMRGGHTGNAITIEHIHDHGKLMFGFMCFWTYVSFSQWMLIWYAGIPEEAVWFWSRWQGGWEVLSVALPIGHFALPFYFLISRVIKRNVALVQFGALWLVIMHVLDIYWYVMPQGVDHFAPSFIDVGALLLVGGAFFALVFKNMQRYPLVPVGDPRLARSLHHHQTY